MPSVLSRCMLCPPYQLAVFPAASHVGYFPPVSIKIQVRANLATHSNTYIILWGRFNTSRKNGKRMNSPSHQIKSENYRYQEYKSLAHP